MNGILGLFTQFSKELALFHKEISKQIPKIFCSIGLHKNRIIRVKGVRLTYWECERCGKRGYKNESKHKPFSLIDIDWLYDKNIVFPRNVLNLKNKFYLIKELEKEKRSLKKLIKRVSQKTYVQAPRIRKRHIKRSKKY